APSRPTAKRTDDMPRRLAMVAPPTKESDVLRQVLAFDPLNLQLWRNTRGRYLHHQSGTWISYGLGPNGAADCIGYRVIRIAPDMVGKRVAQFAAVETKAPGEALSAEQETFLDDVRAAGGFAVMVQSAEALARAMGLLP